jgi:hypothetical protein
MRTTPPSLWATIKPFLIQLRTVRGVTFSSTATSRTVSQTSFALGTIGVPLFILISITRPSGEHSSRGGPGEKPREPHERVLMATRPIPNFRFF